MNTPSAKAHILVIEDEANIAHLVRMYLEREGYRVTCAATGEDGLLATGEADLVILDIALPGIDGIEVCRRLRAAGSVPIILLTARDAEIDRVVGLEMGADDYVTKPFSPRELMARVKAILRRARPEPGEPATLTAGEVKLWPERREVTAGSTLVNLTAKEFDLVLFLMSNRGRVMTRAQILSGVWGYDFFGGERNVDAHIRTVRRKLGEGFPLTTVRGVGYKIEHER